MTFFALKTGKYAKVNLVSCQKTVKNFFWKNTHFDDVITDDVIMAFRGVKWLKMLFSDPFRPKNGQICQSKPCELSKNGQIFLWKNYHCHDVITDDVIVAFRGVNGKKCCFSTFFALKTDKYAKVNPVSCQKTVCNFFEKIPILITSSLMMS